MYNVFHTERQLGIIRFGRGGTIFVDFIGKYWVPHTKINFPINISEITLLYHNWEDYACIHKITSQGSLSVTFEEFTKICCLNQILEWYCHRINITLQVLIQKICCNPFDLLLEYLHIGITNIIILYYMCYANALANPKQTDYHTQTLHNNSSL